MALYGMNKAGRLPNLVIVGAPKCGTTSLHFYLDLHPEIAMSRPKELDFFIEEGNWHRGVEWYASCFRDGRPVCGEASPKYSNCFQYLGVPERMRRVIPGARIIYLVRDPVERMMSQYVHCLCDGLESCGVGDALFPLRPDNRYVGFSMYATQLEAFLEHYDREQILVVSRESLLNERRMALARIFAFLGVDAAFESGRFDEMRQRSADKRRKGRMGVTLKRLAEGRLAWLFPEWLRVRAGRLYHPFASCVDAPMLTDVRWREAVEFFRPEVDRLRSLTGQAFREWLR